MYTFVCCCLLGYQQMLKQSHTLPVNVTYIKTLQCCIYYRSNKHFGNKYFIYAIYVPICIFDRSNKHS